MSASNVPGQLAAGKSDGVKLPPFEIGTMLNQRAKDLRVSIAIYRMVVWLADWLLISRSGSDVTPARSFDLKHVTSRVV